MAIELTCPTCAGRLRVGDEAAGRQIRCGRCQTVFRVPPADPPAPPSPPPPAFELDDDDDRPAARPVRRPRRDEERDSDDGDARPRRRRRDRDDEDDEDDRPRRRRRGPPPSAGRGPLFVAAVVIGVIVLGSIACCGGGYLLLPGEEWRRHESAAGGFAVDLPGAVKKDMQIPGMKADPNVKVEGTVLWKRGEFYAVMYGDLPPPGMRAADDAVLDKVEQEMRNDPQIKRVVRNERVTVSGFAAREIEYVYEDGGTYVGRVIVSGKRLYLVVGGGRFVGPGNANIRRFLDSFAVTDKPQPNRDPWR